MTNILAMLAIAVGLLQSQQARIGTIDFFGTAGVDVQKIRSELPVRKGDEVSEDRSSEVHARISRAVERAVGHPATDVALVCCDEHGALIVYIGLGGANTVTSEVLSAPKGSACLPSQARARYEAATAALVQAIQNGNSGEDDSRGYSLSNDPSAREKQIAMREYVVAHERTVERALRGCREAEQREVAAAMLGYTRKSIGQIAALVHASRDSDAGTRNNAVRALWVLAMASRKTASEIPADSFVEMLNSALWTDRNKAGQLLTALTRFHDPQLLERLRTQTLPSLIEMAQWQNSGHSTAYKVLLGRIAGFDEARIQQLIEEGKMGEILARVQKR